MADAWLAPAHTAPPTARDSNGNPITLAPEGVTQWARAGYTPVAFLEPPESADG